ncbi:hypothetical protein U9M48_012120 [Paspalum notatum var. saurae]|uniref:NB-ARC domain-containing protein n=1 Tax=Paspalum notatum var. saurae TaxID=547442 RepID=A0AAQ3SXK8_PASNO
MENFMLDHVSQNQTSLMKPGSSLSEDTLGTTNNSLMLRDKIHENQFLGDNENMVRKSLTRIWTIASALEESQLVGREKEKFDIINLISKQDDQNPMVISLWGMGGLGKTTLVKEVYQPRAKKDEIDFGLETRKITKIEGLIGELGMFFERKWYLIIVLNDLSSIMEWDMIIRSLPKMENASRIVITTREENIAKHCSRNQENIYKLDVLGYKDALGLFTNKVFKEATNLNKHPALIEEANMILKKCNGLPLQ